jgi:hypothetical protein
MAVTAELQQDGTTLETNSSVLSFQINGLKEKGNAVNRLIAAYDAIPTVAANHPLPGFNFITKRVVSFDSHDAAVGEALYERKAESKVTVRMGTITEVVQTSRDFEGLNMFIPHSMTAGADQPGKPDGEPVDKMATAQKFIPRTTVIISGSTSGAPYTFGPKFVGSINSLPWLGKKLLGGGFNKYDKVPGSWLCTSVDVPEFQPSLAARRGDGKEFPVIATFAYNPETWNPVITLINPESGNPYDNVGKVSYSIKNGYRYATPGTAANGVKVFGIQKPENFTEMKWMYANG